MIIEVSHTEETFEAFFTLEICWAVYVPFNFSLSIIDMYFLYFFSIFLHMYFLFEGVHSLYFDTAFILFLIKLYFSSNVMIMKFRKRFFRASNIILFTQKFDWTKIKSTIVSKFNKNRCIRTDLLYEYYIITLPYW